MYKDKWLKPITQHSNVCSATSVNNKIIFFDGHGIHFDDRALIHMDQQNIQPFILKAGESVNDQPNDNGTNDKLMSLYNEVKSVWILKYGMTKLLTHLMN